MSREVWIVDAFAAHPFAGNPAGVCIMEAYPDDATLQRMAAELNLSETAFAVKNSPLDYRLRWFTPTVEVNLCGHATLATTHILHQTGVLRDGDGVTYRSLSGDLHARVRQQAIELDFPALEGKPVTPHPALSALGVEMLACEINRDNYLVEVKDHATLLACAPDFQSLSAMDRQGVIVTTSNGLEGFDFASRYFGPNCGVNEDPVTGSAHCFLGPYWAKKLGKRHFHAVQSSQRRGVLEVTLEDDRVRIAGKAITILKGQWQIALETFKEKAA